MAFRAVTKNRRYHRQTINENQNGRFIYVYIYMWHNHINIFIFFPVRFLHKKTFKAVNLKIHHFYRSSNDQTGMKIIYPPKKYIWNGLCWATTDGKMGF